jgi:hypothetical protein
MIAFETAQLKCPFSYVIYLTVIGEMTGYLPIFRTCRPSSGHAAPDAKLKEESWQSDIR